MAKKIFTPLENLNYKPTRIRNHKFLTGFIFFIILLIFLSFLIFNFRKTEKIEAQAYCDVSGNCKRQIIGVQLTSESGTMSKSSGCPAGGYEDYTGFSATVAPNETFTLAVTVRYYSGSAKINAVAFFDWNQDFDFSDSGERVNLGSCTASDVESCTITASITVPATASIGTTRMRVVAGGILSYIQPCGSGLYSANGNAEDYTIIINRPPTISSVSDSPDPQKGGSAVTFSSAASDPDAGDTIKLYVCKDAACTGCDPASPTKDDDCWAYSPTGVATNPSASYTCPSCKVSTNNYWAKVCDNNGACSSIKTGGGGSFTCKKENGCAETVAANCFSGFAADGYCCNSACTGTCQQCDATPGTCTTRGEGDNVECPYCYYCDGENINCVAVTCPAGEYCVDNECIKPNLHGFAWSENIGWISFNSANCDLDNNGYIDVACGGDNSTTPVITYGVYLPKLGTDGSKTGQRFFKGFAWSENIGWIKFNPPEPYPDAAVTDCHNSPSYLEFGTDTYGLIRACAGAPNPDTCGGGIGPNPDSGGWDGWICLDDLGSSPPAYPDYPGVRLNTTKNEFERWAWGGGGTSEDGTNAVVGWISWNHRNCDPNGDGDPSDGPAQCVEPGRDYSTNPIPEYKVTYKPANDPPTVSGIQLDGEPKYCNVGPGQGQISFKWTYNDIDNDPQSRFDFRVNDVNNVNDPDENCGNCEVNRSFTGLSNPSGTVNTQTVLVETPLQADKITYNTSYYWWVRVFDDKGGDSGWVQYNDPADTNEDPPDSNPITFTTISHAKPWVDFGWCPFEPNIGDTIQFCSQIDGTYCDGAPLCPNTPVPDVTCYGPGGEVACPATGWSWTFPDPGGECPDPLADWCFEAGFNAASKNPAGQFANPGGKPVSLTVTDSDALSCTISKTVPVEIELPLPTWKEIPPTF